MPKRKRTIKVVPRRTVKARKARKVARVGTVKRMISRSEETKWKHVTNQPVRSGWDGPPNIIKFNEIGKGVDRTNRDGNVIFMKSLELYVTIAANSDPRGVNRCRLLVFLDKQANGADPNLKTLFAGYDGSTAFDPSTMMTPLNKDYFGKRYKLLRDRLLVVGQEGGAADYSNERTFRMNIPLKGVRVQYANTNTGEITDIIKNSLIAVAISDEQVGNQPNLTFKSVLTWKDS